MIGLYSAASGMLVQWTSMDVISNNLANVNTTSFKKDETVFKSFPERMMARYNDSIQKFPLGSYDNAPIIGRMGTGVEVNDVFTRFESKDGENNFPIRKTENKMDLALNGEGFFAIDTADGERYTRDGAFTRNERGILVDMNGNAVLGKKGPIALGNGDFKVDEEANIYVKAPLAIEWQKVDELKLVDFYEKQGLTKVGKNYYSPTEDAGEMNEPNHQDLKVLQGFLEGSNVNPVREMTTMIEVQRLYEACQKGVETADQVLGKESNEIARLP
jgi:flagellar basal-body rod protein FlgF